MQAANDPLKRFTLNIVFEDTNFQNNEIVQSLYNTLTGHQGNLNLANQQINMRPHLLDSFISSLTGAEQLLAVNGRNDASSEVKFMRICLQLSQPYLSKLNFHPDEPIDLGVRFHHLQTYTSRNDLNFDLDEMSLDVWIMDSDGLSLNSQSMNEANHMSVMNLRPFFEISKPRGGHRDWRRDWYNRQQSAEQENSGRNNPSSDHIIIILNPNLEPIIFDTSDESKELIQQEFKKDTIEVFDRRDGRVNKLPHTVLVGISYLSRSQLPIKEQKIEFKPGEEIKQELANILFSEPWDPTRLNDVFSKSLGIEDFVRLCAHETEPDDTRLRADFVSGSVYLRKYKVNNNGRPQFLALPRSTSLEDEEIINSITELKWTVVNSNEDGSHQTSWSSVEICNAPIQINGQLEFCQNPVEDSLRCGECGN